MSAREHLKQRVDIRIPGNILRKKIRLARKTAPYRKYDHENCHQKTCVFHRAHKPAIILTVASKECELFFNNVFYVPSKFRSRSKFVCCQIVWWRSLYHEKLNISYKVCMHGLPYPNFAYNRPAQDTKGICALRNIYDRGMK